MHELLNQKDRVQSWLCCLGSNIFSLSLNFLTYKMGIITVSAS